VGDSIPPSIATSEKVHLLRCASPFVIAAYVEDTPHASGLARLASGAFYEAVNFLKVVITRLDRVIQF
jgi:hypothetical protein